MSRNRSLLKVLLLRATVYRRKKFLGWRILHAVWRECCELLVWQSKQKDKGQASKLMQSSKISKRDKHMYAINFVSLVCYPNRTTESFFMIFHDTTVVIKKKI